MYTIQWEVQEVEILLVDFQIMNSVFIIDLGLIKFSIIFIDIMQICCI